MLAHPQIMFKLCDMVLYHFSGIHRDSFMIQCLLDTSTRPTKNEMNDWLSGYKKTHSNAPHTVSPYTSQWRHNKRNGVSNHRRLDCLLNRLFSHSTKKISKVRVTGLCGENRWFPAQRASNAEKVSIWWRHHDKPFECRSVSMRDPCLWMSLQLTVLGDQMAHFEVKYVMTFLLDCQWFWKHFRLTHGIVQVVNVWSALLDLPFEAYFTVSQDSLWYKDLLYQQGFT